MVSAALESIRSQLDEACGWDAQPVVASADAAGTIVESTDPTKVGSLQRATRFVAAAFPGQTAAGSVVVSNDPGRGSSDIAEMTVVRGLAELFVATRIRIPDIGGFNLGGASPEALDVWGEGALFPALRIAIAGKERGEGRQLLRINSRTPALLDRALDSIVAATQDLELELDRAEVDRRRRGEAEQASRALADLRPGVYSAEAPIHVPGHAPGPAVRVTLDLTDAPRISFAASDPAVEFPINSTPARTLDCCLAQLDEDVDSFLAGPGALDAIEIEVGDGLLTGSVPPRATALSRFVTAATIREVVRDVLVQAGASPGGESWWDREGRKQFEAEFDQETLHLRPDLVTAILDLERETGRR